jgi:hypothetical protein
MRGLMPGMPKYIPLEGENHITGKVPGQPGYKPMTPAEAARFDKYGNETTPQPKMERVVDKETGKTKMSPALLPEELRNIRSGGGGGGAGIPKVGPKKPLDMKKGGVVKSSASKRGDGCAIKGKTRGRMV